MKDVALVTGASSGIGRDLARIHAATGGDLVIVARRQRALEELRDELVQRHAVEVVCFAADLSAPETVRKLHADLLDRGTQVDYLLNNAGFGGHGAFHQRAWEEEEAMIRLNVLALCEMTHCFLPGMVQRGAGRVLNVASTAGFVPGPLQAVYYATKAFVLSFSQAIAEELSGTGVTVTALCPGPVATEFSARAGLANVRAFDRAAPSSRVARVGYDAMKRGDLVAIDDWRLSLLLNWILPFLPRRLVLKLSRRSMESS